MDGEFSLAGSVTSQDTALVFGLEDAKFTSDEVKEKVKIAQETGGEDQPHLPELL